ncbi:aryldialkylphosphatase [Vallitalea longa]|uniref:Aryldialkylphosphatase n=1 Tax=Vallitalea longa TaxID=2936439 RepID=A0A9W5YA45_9FIRM|nr:amidohydrolase family protein [Vallitalea longa]GKX28926.1 aryldialkylphosphatase [Vallitalea longa]
MKKILLFIIFLLLLLVSCTKSKDKSVDLGITNCSIVDVESGTIKKNGTIVVNNHNIIDIVFNNNKKYTFNETLDINHQYILPGFINAHVHLSSTDDYVQLQKWAKNGVTAVRTMNDFDNGTLTKMKSELNNDNANCTLFTSTPIITKPNGYGRYFIESVNEAIEAVEHHIPLGVDVIKISIEDSINRKTYNMLELDEIKAITKTAHDNNLKVTAHVTNSYNIPLVLDGNVDEIAHMIIGNVNDEDIKALIDKGVTWIPTMELWKGVSNKYSLDYYDIAIDNLKRFYNAGGTVVFGTDYDGFDIKFDDEFPITEVTTYKEAGISNIDIIRSATINAAKSCDVDDRLGSIAEGKIADLIICKENPLENIDILTNLSYVIHNGQIISNTN